MSNQSNCVTHNTPYIAVAVAVAIAAFMLYSSQNNGVRDRAAPRHERSRSIKRLGYVLMPIVNSKVSVDPLFEVVEDGYKREIAIDDSLQRLAIVEKEGFSYSQDEIVLLYDHLEPSYWRGGNSSLTPIAINAGQVPGEDDLFDVIILMGNTNIEFRVLTRSQIGKLIQQQTPAETKAFFQALP